MNSSGQPYQPAERNKKRRKNVPLRIIVIALILGAGVGLALFLKKTAPVAGRAQPKKQARLVDVTTLESHDISLRVTAYGQVEPSRQLSLMPEVSGRIVELNPDFEAGACLPAGTLVCRIDPRDYELDVAEKKAALQKAQAALDLELGQQQIARTEWEMYQQRGVGDIVPSSPSADLVLRKPELQQARAEVENAGVALEQARLDLERTEILLPFDALVLEEHVEQGSYVGAQTEMATLVATGTFWITAAVPVADLQWISMAGESDEAVLVYPQGGDRVRSGHIVRLLGNLTDEGRMAQILVAVPDPLELTKDVDTRIPLLLGTYLKLELPGKQLSHAMALPRALVHNGNEVWIAAPDGTLEIRRIEPLRRDVDKVYIDSGIQSGEKVITSNLAYAVEGMAIKENIPLNKNEAQKQ